MAEMKKGGRPPKPRGERAATVNLTLRLAPKLLEQLRRSAELNQRSIAAEAQRRLAQGEINDIAKMVGLVVSALEERSGKHWSTDLEIKTQCRMAAGTVLDLVLGYPTDLETLLNEVQSIRDSFEKEIAGGGDTVVIEEIKKQFRRVSGLAEARLVANDIISKEHLG